MDDHVVCNCGTTMTQGSHVVHYEDCDLIQASVDDSLYFQDD